MNTFLQLLISGLALGCVYALLALGFVVVFKATEVVNFAHASLVMVGIYVTARVRESGTSFPVALLLGALAAVAVALLIERFFVRPTARKSLVAAAIMTIGVDIVVQTDITRRLGIDILPVGDPWASNTVEILGVTVPETRIAALVVAVLVLVAFFVWFKKSEWGVAMRATAEDHATAELMGVRLGRVSALTWAIAAVLATVAGLFLATFPSPGVSPGVSTAALRAFPAAILGGLTSPVGALVGGLIIGVSETMTQGYQQDLLFLGDGFSAVMPYVVMVAVLLVRPSGLFGVKEVARV